MRASMKKAVSWGIVIVMLVMLCPLQALAGGGRAAAEADDGTSESTAAFLNDPAHWLFSLLR